MLILDGMIDFYEALRTGVNSGNGGIQFLEETLNVLNTKLKL